MGSLRQSPYPQQINGDIGQMGGQQQQGWGNQLGPDITSAINSVMGKPQGNSNQMAYNGPTNNVPGGMGDIITSLMNGYLQNPNRIYNGIFGSSNNGS